jgi:hypothetical protein
MHQNKRWNEETNILKTVVRTRLYVEVLREHPSNRGLAARIRVQTQIEKLLLSEAAAGAAAADEEEEREHRSIMLAVIFV